MGGVLTDRDIAFLANISSGINVTDGGIKGSVEGVKARLNQVKSTLQKAAKDKGIELGGEQAVEPTLDDLLKQYGGGQ
jgi:hypothetical protein